MIEIAPRFAGWEKIPKADPSPCTIVKKYGQLGLWTLNTEQELKVAENLGADIIETNGAIKPRKF